MLQRAVKVVVILALLMVVVISPAGASVNLAVIGTAKVGADPTAYNLVYDSSQSLLWLDYTKGFSLWSTANCPCQTLSQLNS
jgi:hypothetical protein